MEFTFDLSQTPVIERRHRRAGLASYGLDSREEAATSPRRSLSLSTADSSTFSGWKRPWMSQVETCSEIEIDRNNTQSRVRECLVNLLSVCGQKVGLPKSPSVSTRVASSSPDKTPDLSPFLKIPPLCSGPGLISKGWPVTFSLFTVVCTCCCKDLHFNEALWLSPLSANSFFPLPPNL